MAPYHFTVQSAAAALPVQTEQQLRFVTLLQRGTMSLELYAPGAKTGKRRIVRTSSTSSSQDTASS